MGVARGGEGHQERGEEDGISPGPGPGDSPSPGPGPGDDPSPGPGDSPVQRWSGLCLLFLDFDLLMKFFVPERNNYTEKIKRR